MSSSSSSCPPPKKLSILVAPVEITVVQATEDTLVEQLEEIAKKFSMPVSHLVLSGCVKVFSGDAVHVRVRDASLHVDP